MRVVGVVSELNVRNCDAAAASFQSQPAFQAGGKIPAATASTPPHAGATSTLGFPVSLQVYATWKVLRY